MTVKYFFVIGMQQQVIYGDQPWGLGLQEKILPELFKQKDYMTRAVGKWHLGHFKAAYLPENRGSVCHVEVNILNQSTVMFFSFCSFDSHYGYWVGHQDYYDHCSQENVRNPTRNI